VEAVSIPIPEHISRVEGCGCGGLNYHRSSTPWDPENKPCPIWDLEPEQRVAAVTATSERMRRFTEELNERVRQEWRP
jgi:hypothetical protein